MKRPITVKKSFSSLLSFLLVLTLLLCGSILPNAFAAGSLFAGVEDKQVVENTVFNLLQGVTATDADGAQLPVEVTNVINKSDPSYVYDGNPNITIGSAGNIYQVEYTAYSGNSEKHTAERTIVSITASGSAESHEESINYTSSAGNSIPIIFENGLHYAEDPAYPNERIILYCMNNKLAWPHATPDHPNVPDYSEGYLTPDKFQSVEDYETCLHRLKKLLFAGYPYNGERLYKIISTEEQHTPTEQEFNEMLILPPQLKTAFPYLAHYRFTLDDVDNPQYFELLTRFMGEVMKLRPDKETPNGLHYDDITAMPFYKAVNALTYGGVHSTKKDVLEYFSAIYSDSYFVTEEQAYNATQLAVWRLLNAYGIEHNDITSLESNQLAQILWLYSLHGDLLTREPDENEIRIEGDLTFTYNSKDGLWHSGTLKIIEPPSYNGLYELMLPKGVTALCEGLTYVYGNEPYELVSRQKPTSTSKFAVKAHIDWLKDMKQYSPVNSQDFQHMIGAVIKKKSIAKVIPYNAQEDGCLQISKAVIGNSQNQQEPFYFVLELSDKSCNGLYGDLEFHNGIAEFTLKNAQTITAQHLPVGISYKIMEVDADGYRVEATNAEGTITSGDPIEVLFTNTKLNSLLLSKTVEGEMGDKTKRFTFTIGLKDSAGAPLNGSFPYFIDMQSNGEKMIGDYIESGTLVFQDGAATVHLSHDQQIHINDIPYGTHYSITEAEANQDGYTTSFNGSGQTGTLDESQEVHVVNRKEYVPETGVRDAGSTGITVLLCVAAIGLCIPVLYEIVRKKRFLNR